MSQANWSNINNSKLYCCISTFSRNPFYNVRRNEEIWIFCLVLGQYLQKMRGRRFERISKMLVLGLREESRLPGDTITCRLGPGLEENQEPCWNESAVLTAVPWRHVSVRFYFSRSCPSNDGTGKTPKSSNHGAQREATIWLDGRLRRTLSWSRSTKQSHKMKKEEPCLKHHHNYYNDEAVKLHPVIYFCLTRGCLRTSCHEMHPHILLTVLHFTTGSFSALQIWIYP